MDFPGRSLVARWTIPVLLTACLSACGAPPVPVLQPLPQELGAFSAEYGPAIINEGDFAAEARVKPWSGYWYPLARIDARSALAKYDRLTGKKALFFDEQRIQSEGRPFQPWEGRCDAWAFASILQTEPLAQKTIEFNGQREVFSVSEQKALWIYSHELVDPALRHTVGQRNDGDGDSAFQDIAPAEFHRIIQIMLQDRRLPFIMDRDPRPAVWNTPVYGARWTIQRDRSRADLFHVHTWVHAVFPYDEDRDSIERIAPVLEYRYDLEAHPVSGGFAVHSSRWTGRSVREHPDFVTLVELQDRPGIRSMNSELDPEWLRLHLQ